MEIPEQPNDPYERLEQKYRSGSLTPAFAINSQMIANANSSALEQLFHIQNGFVGETEIFNKLKEIIDELRHREFSFGSRSPRNILVVNSEERFNAREVPIIGVDNLVNTLEEQGLYQMKVNEVLEVVKLMVNKDGKPIFIKARIYEVLDDTILKNSYSLRYHPNTNRFYLYDDETNEPIGSVRIEEGSETNN